MSEDSFWTAASRRLIFWLGTTVRLAGNKITPDAMLQALQDIGLSLEAEKAPTGYFRELFKAINERRDAYEFPAEDIRLYSGTLRFWEEFVALPHVTRSPIIFDVMSRLERAVYGCEPPEELSALDMGFFD